MTTSPTHPDPETLRNSARQLVRILQQHGHIALWAGGSVRDQLMGKDPKDIDIATDARPEQIQKLFSHAIPIGKAFGVMLVHHQNIPFEIATFRTESDYTDGRHPDHVQFTTPQQDAQRRDFTINGLFYDPIQQTVHDYVNGQQDIRDRCLRAIGNPAERFQEDHLRLLRAIRFSATLQFHIHPDTAQAIQQKAPLIHTVAPERVQQELTRILLEAPQPGFAFRLLQQLHLLPHILPEIAALDGQAQPPQYHPEGDVFTHTLLMLDHMPPQRTPILAYSVLLHDVGKPPTATIGPGTDGQPRIRFDGHAEVGARMTEEILRRLRCPNEWIDAVTYCVAHHMAFIEVPNMRKSTLRRLIGAPTFPTEIELHRLDCLCSHGDLRNIAFLNQFQQQLAAEPVLPPRWITGHDLLALGITPGPPLGAWLRHAYDAQIEGRFPDRQTLLQNLQHLITQSPLPPSKA